MIKKYDENLDTSLSFISDFNLEDDEKRINDSFKSSDNDNSGIEQIEIKAKSSKNIYIHKFDDEIEPEFEKEFEDIKDFLLTKRLSN